MRGRSEVVVGRGGRSRVGWRGEPKLAMMGGGVEGG